MIYDHIDNLNRYNFPHRSAIAAFLKQHNPLDLVKPEIEILGRELFVRISEYETKLPAAGKFEAHRLYADLQFVVAGGEVMQTYLRKDVSPLTDYDPSGDYQFFDVHETGTDVIVPSGYFTVFFPGEFHRPCCHWGSPRHVKKLVFKIRIK